MTKQPAVAVGQRYEIKWPISVENYAVGQTGDRGTIVKIDDDCAWLQMDIDHGDLLSDWDNCLCFMLNWEPEFAIENNCNLIEGV